MLSYYSLLARRRWKKVSAKVGGRVRADRESDEGKAVLMSAKVTERQAARAARQLLYHRRLSEWISRKMSENEATLESYLIGSGEDKAVLLGGYVPESAGEDQESSVEILEPIARPEYEQLELLAAFECSEVS